MLGNPGKFGEAQETVKIQRNLSPGGRPGSSVKEAISSGRIAFLVWIPANPTRFQQILANPRESQRIPTHSRFLERSLGPRQSRPNHWREMEFIEDPEEPMWITTDPNTIQETALPVLCTHRFSIDFSMDLGSQFGSILSSRTLEN